MRQILFALALYCFLAQAVQGGYLYAKKDSPDWWGHKVQERSLQNSEEEEENGALSSSSAHADPPSSESSENEGKGSPSGRGGRGRKGSPRGKGIGQCENCIRRLQKQLKQVAGRLLRSAQRCIDNAQQKKQGRKRDSAVSGENGGSSEVDSNEVKRQLRLLLDALDQ